MRSFLQRDKWFLFGIVVSPLIAFLISFVASCGGSSGGDDDDSSMDDDSADDAADDATDDAADDSTDDVSDDAADDTSADDDSAGPQTVDVDIPGFSFNPATITINVGDTVRWTNSHSIHHTVTSGAPGDPDAGDIFDSGEMLHNGTYEFTFASAGTYPYFCTYHTMMTGNVIVN